MISAPMQPPPAKRPLAAPTGARTFNCQQPCLEGKGKGSLSKKNTRRLLAMHTDVGSFVGFQVNVEVRKEFRQPKDRANATIRKHSECILCEELRTWMNCIHR